MIILDVNRLPLIVTFVRVPSSNLAIRVEVCSSTKNEATASIFDPKKTRRIFASSKKCHDPKITVLLLARYSSVSTDRLTHLN